MNTLPLMNRNAGEIGRLIEIMRQLRSPTGCPWDRKQTTASLIPFAIEEVAEFMESADDGDVAGMKEELGDMLMHIVLHSVIAEENGWFKFEDVVDAISEKMVRRHPHVFGEHPKLAGAEEVPGLWEQVKQQEKPTTFKSVLGKYPRFYPALLRAHKTTMKAAKVGFDWASGRDVLAKVDEEYAELREALDEHDQAHIDEEIGDLLFVIVNLARHCSGHDAEVLLRKACEKFERRFHYIEKRLIEESKAIESTDITEMESLWQEAKKRGVN